MVDARTVAVVVLEPPTTAVVVRGVDVSVTKVEAPAAAVEATDCALAIADEAPASAVEMTDCAEAMTEDAPAAAVEAAEEAEATTLLAVKMALGLSDKVG